MDERAVRQTYASVQRAFDRASGERAAIDATLAQYTAEVETLRQEHADLAKLAEVFSALGQRLQTRFVGSVEQLVTQGLRSVFGGTYEFRVVQGTYGKQPTMAFVVADGPDDAEGLDLLTAHGGGMASLVGVLLRIVVVRLLATRGHRQAIFLDEALGMLSAQYREAAALLLRDLSRDLGLQIVLISHQAEYEVYADQTVHLEKRDGVTRRAQA